MLIVQKIYPKNPVSLRNIMSAIALREAGIGNGNKKLANNLFVFFDVHY